MAEVVFRNVGKRFGDVVVVRDFDLEIADGEFMVLVGPSGCGKSTTLRMLAGLEAISEGDVFIGSRRVNDVHPKNRDIAMVFQSYALYPHMNVRDNMGFGLRMRGAKKAEIGRRVADAAAILGLTDLLDRKPKALSGGQRQRVAMGRAIVRDAKVFLFDEPLSNLDAKLRVQMRAEIAKLHRRLQKTILYVTHDQVEAMTLADRIVILHNGRIQQVGTPLETYEHPSNRFVAGFIGSPAMNFLPCNLAEGPRLQGDGFSLSLPASLQRALSDRSGELEMGLRPNHFAVEPAAEQPRPERMRAKVEVVEPMGSETMIYARLGETLLTVRQESQAAAATGAAIDLVPDLERAHLFDARTGETIA